MTPTPTPVPARLASLSREWEVERERGRERAWERARDRLLFCHCAILARLSLMRLDGPLMSSTVGRVNCEVKVRHFITGCAVELQESLTNNKQMIYRSRFFLFFLFSFLFIFPPQALRVLFPSILFFNEHVDVELISQAFNTWKSNWTHISKLILVSLNVPVAKCQSVPIVWPFSIRCSKRNVAKQLKRVSMGTCASEAAIHWNWTQWDGKNEF